MIDYLLGALPETDVERLDELSLADDAFAERLGAVENDLVDAYVRGELRGERFERFNTHYLASPRRREKVNVARTFLRFTKQAAGAAALAPGVAPRTAETKKNSSPSWLRLTRLRPRLAMQWGLAAAALLLLLAGGYLWLENARLRNQMAQTQAERAALQQREQDLQKQLDEQRSANAQTASELAGVRERLAQLDAQVATQQNEDASPAGRDLRIASFTLAPPTRGGQVAEITLSAGTTIVALRLQLEADDFRAYQAALKDPATDQVIWRSGRLKANGKVVAVRLPAGLLKPQHYTLELTGSPGSGPAEIISSYPFTVVIQSPTPQPKH